MSHKTSLRVWEHSQTQRAARCLMLALADFANDDGICWPGTAVLAKKINESADYTDTIIKKCIAMGELAKHAGHGRGHTSRFAILCGLTPDAQNKLKGVLQKGYPSTPIDKRGTPKGVLLPDKRGTIPNAKYPTNGASETGIPPIDEKQILHDPDHGGGGGARPPDSIDPFVALFAHHDITQAEPLARLYREKWPDTTVEQLTRLCEHLSEPDAGSYAGARLYRKLKAGPYERPTRSDHAPDQRERPAQPPKRSRGSHNPTGGAEIHNPGWKERLIAQAERGELP